MAKVELDIEAGIEKLSFYARDLKLATLEGAGAFSGTECTVPASGDWTITANCIVSSFKTAPGNVTVNAGITLTIAPAGVLEVNLNTKKLLVKSTGNVLIRQGGAIAQTGRLTPPQGGQQSTLVFHHTDHLSGASVDTDASGNVLQLTDYYPYGDSRIDETTSSFHNDYTYTGKERDEDTTLLYYEARYYDSHLGRFISIDPWDGDITDPQSFNRYAYVRNNPLRYTDPKGTYWETAIDAIFFALSYRQVMQDPTLANYIFAYIDGVALAAPIPDAVGYARNGAKAYKIEKYFAKVAEDSGKSALHISTTFAKNAGFVQARRAWTVGPAGDSLANLVGHFEEHGAEFGAKNVDEYYKVANDFIDSFSRNVDNVTWTEKAKDGTIDTVLWDQKANTVAIMDEKGNVRSVYKPNKQSKIDDLNSKRDRARKNKQNENKV